MIILIPGEKYFDVSQTNIFIHKKRFFAQKIWSIFKANNRRPTLLSVYYYYHRIHYRDVLQLNNAYAIHNSNNDNKLNFTSESTEFCFQEQLNCTFNKSHKMPFFVFTNNNSLLIKQIFNFYANYHLFLIRNKFCFIFLFCYSLYFLILLIIIKFLLFVI